MLTEMCLPISRSGIELQPSQSKDSPKVNRQKSVNFRPLQRSGIAVQFVKLWAKTEQARVLSWIYTDRFPNQQVDVPLVLPLGNHLDCSHDPRAMSFSEMRLRRPKTYYTQRILADSTRPRKRSKRFCIFFPAVVSARGSFTQAEFRRNGSKNDPIPSKFCWCKPIFRVAYMLALLGFSFKIIYGHPAD